MRVIYRYYKQSGLVISLHCRIEKWSSYTSPGEQARGKCETYERFPKAHLALALSQQVVR